MSAPKPCMGYPSQLAASKALGFAVSTLSRNMQKYGHMNNVATHEKPCDGYPSIRAAARALGVAASTIRFHMNAHGNLDRVGARPVRAPVPPETRAAILECASRGLTAAQIGIKLKISPNSAQGVIRRHRGKQND